MDLLTAEWSTQLPLELQPLEMAERKGLGHPDTLCDLMAEAISQALCTEYLRVAGRVLHHNIENAFLVAGRSEPAFGGGRVLGPMRFVYGDHATTDVDGRPLAVDAIAEAAALGVLQQLIPHLDGARHIVFQNELRPGSAQLVALVHAERAGANDTCIGSGFAPLSETSGDWLRREGYRRPAMLSPGSGDLARIHRRTGTERALLLRSQGRHLRAAAYTPGTDAAARAGLGGPHQHC